MSILWLARRIDRKYLSAMTETDLAEGGMAPRLSIRQRVVRRAQQFTPAEQQVATALLRRPRLVVDSPIYDLARELNVAPAVISRFSRAIGLPGYRALRLALAEELGAEAAISSRRQAPPAPAPGSGAIWQAACTSMTDDVAAIQQNLEALDPAAMTVAGTMLATANRVVTDGNDASGLMARRLAGMLARRGFRARAEISPNDATWANDLDPGDVVVVISHRGQSVSPTAGILPAIPVIRSHGARLLAVTNRPDSPVGRASDAVVATLLWDDGSDDAYTFAAVLPVQVVVVRALVAATLAARDCTR
jgi:DNA-binding MurR/RpiR family transcriptional regulator